MLQELAAHSLANNISIISKHQKGDSGEWSISADKISRNIHIEKDNVLQRDPTWDQPNFWLTNIREKSVVELLTVLSLTDRKRLAKSPLLKEGISLKRLRLKNRINRKGKGREKVHGNGNLPRGTVGDRTMSGPK